jgi:hypothetical protein
MVSANVGGGVCADRGVVNRRTAAKRIVFICLPYAGANRIRFRGCDLRPEWPPRGWGKNSRLGVEVNLKNLEMNLQNLEINLKNLEVNLKNLEINLENLEVNLKNLEINLKNREINLENLEVNLENLEVNLQNLEVNGVRGHAFREIGGPLIRPPGTFSSLPRGEGHSITGHLPSQGEKVPKGVPDLAKNAISAPNAPRLPGSRLPAWRRGRWRVW